MQMKSAFGHQPIWIRVFDHTITITIKARNLTWEIEAGSWKLKAMSHQPLTWRQLLKWVWVDFLPKGWDRGWRPNRHVAVGGTRLVRWLVKRPRPPNRPKIQPNFPNSQSKCNSLVDLQYWYLYIFNKVDGSWLVGEV